MLAIIGMQAAEVSGTITFKTSGSDSSTAATTSNFVSGQIASYDFTGLTCTATNNCYTGISGLKMSSSKANGAFTLKFASSLNVKSVTVTAVKYGSDAAKVSVEDATAITLTSSMADYKFDVNKETQTIKVAATKRLYIKSITITYDDGQGGGDTPDTPEPEDVPEPTFNPTDGETFDESLDVTISVDGEDYKIWYKLNEGTYQEYEEAINITETTTIVAYAENADGDVSEEVTATYTKIAPPPAGEQVEATISFATTAQRVSQDDNSQVWSNAGITFTNNKASSSTKVANYVPVRLYAGSNVVVECDLGVMTEIVFVATSDSYATALKNSIGTAATVSGSNVTVSGINANTFTIAKLTAQVRLNSMTVTYVKDENAVDVAEPTFSHEAGLVERGTVVTIDVEEGLIACYSLTGEAESFVEGNQVTINETTTIYAYAQDANENKSDTLSRTYTIPVEGTWELVTDAASLRAGDELVIVAAESDYALSTEQKTNNRGQAPVKKVDNYVLFAENVQVLTLEAGTVADTWAFNTGSGYLYAAGSDNNNHLKIQKENNENGSWAISISDGIAGVVACGENTNNKLRYNKASSLFSCYDEGQEDISLYRKYVEREVYPENIVAGDYYLELGAWVDGTNAWYAMYVCNKNNNPETGEWVVGYHTVVNDAETVIYDYTGGNTYTHMIFCRMDYNNKYVANWDNVIEKTDLLTFTPATTEDYFAKYVIDNKALPAEELNAGGHWSEFDPNIGTGIEGVESIAAIRYANGVVVAEGAIEVYNVNGMVVARGNETIDLRNLAAGVYIVRNGNNVRKVVR